ncbi:MAG TPA: MFS transporter [Candidatus Edwardsbacteria bacterium]|nr:MFS transporter [Candidatus Edwardsbacteria bacterium]
MLRALRFIADYGRVVRGFSPNARRYLLSTFLMSASGAIAGVIFNLYLNAAGFHEAFIGGMLSLGGLALGAFAIPAGLAADRYGRKPAMVWGLLLSSALLLLRALTTGRALLVAASFMGGIAATVYGLATAPFMMENSSERQRTHLFSVSYAVMLAAGVVGSLVGGELPAACGRILATADPFLQYRMTLVLAALLSFAAVLPLLGISEAPPPAAERQRTPATAGRGDWLLIGKFAWCNLWIGLGAGLVIPFFNLYFVKRFGAGSGQIGFYFSVSQVFTLLAVLAAPAIARRAGKVRTVVLMELLSLPFLVSLGAERVLAVAVASFWARASLMQMSTPIGSAFAMELLPQRLRATANSVMSMSWNLLWAASTAASGWMMQRYGYAIPYYLTAVCYAVSAVSYYLFFHHRERMPSGPAPRPATS